MNNQKIRTCVIGVEETRFFYFLPTSPKGNYDHKELCFFTGSEHGIERIKTYIEGYELVVADDAPCGIDNYNVDAMQLTNTPDVDIFGSAVLCRVDKDNDLYPADADEVMMLFGITA